MGAFFYLAPDPSQTMSDFFPLQIGHKIFFSLSLSFAVLKSNEISHNALTKLPSLQKCFTKKTYLGRSGHFSFVGWSFLLWPRTMNHLWSLTDLLGLCLDCKEVALSTEEKALSGRTGYFRFQFLPFLSDLSVVSSGICAKFLVYVLGRDGYTIESTSANALSCTVSSIISISTLWVR